MAQVNKKMSTLAFAAASLFVIAFPSSSIASGVVAGATEITQIANNALLATSVVQQATQVTEAIASKVLLAQQYITMVQNLKNLPQDMMNKMLEPYRTQIAAFTELGKSVKDLKLAAEDTKAMFSSRGMDFSASGKDFKSYLQYEIALADKKGGIYKKRMEQDLASMDAMKEKSAALRTAALKTSSITGTVQGLQQLSQTSSVAAGELMEIKSAILAQNVDRNQDKLEAEAAAKNKAILMGAMAKGASERTQRDAATTMKFPDPYGSNWNGLETQR